MYKVEVRSFQKAVNSQNLSSGMVSGLLAAAGPPIIILEAAANGHFTNEQTILWMFAVHFFGGLFSIILPLYYRMPIVGGHSITAVAFLATVAAQFSFHELIGSYIISSLIILVIGLFGLFSKLLKYVPKEIIAATMAGIIANYVVRFILSIQHIPLIGIVALLTYFLFTKWKLRIPPVIAAIFAGFLMLSLTTNLRMPGKALAFVFPHIQTPSFHLLVILTVSIPLALLILSNDAATGIGAMTQNNFRPPVNRIIAYSGLFSFVAALFGGQSANIAGMMSAICSGEESGPKDKRYIAAVISGILILLFGIFSWLIVPFIKALPVDFVSMLAGFALMGVLTSSLHLSFSNPKLIMSVTFTFVIALSNITIFYISAPVWALTAGSLLVHLIERKQIKSSGVEL